MNENSAPTTSTDTAGTGPVMRGGSSVVLFDGVCNFCNASVLWIIARDPGARFRFASIQSRAGQAVLIAHSSALAREPTPDSIVLVEHGGVFFRSDAAIRIARGLGFPWSMLGVSRVVPRELRDGVYRWVARNRYSWFGKLDACALPTAELRARFLSDEELTREPPAPIPAA